ncbi:hypothetical protein FKX85_02385 [Echinicola soli]|uniref:Uncharacterized protein n=1 Tax=Echinicola soli TaxID=2591634 RepID=A0A514CDQ7_9BACT|nr:hypothetical protein [Echinicola soli]QDH77946.1 hypothetical protein FKX85_02385 [Echinicola soli]
MKASVVSDFSIGIHSTFLQRYSGQEYGQGQGEYFLSSAPLTFIPSRYYAASKRSEWISVVTTHKNSIEQQWREIG